MLTLANPNGFALLFFLVHAHHHFLDWIANSLTIGGSTLRARDGMTKQTIAAELEETVWPLFQSGDIAVVLDSVYDLEDAAEAHRRMETSEHIGKIAINVSA